MSDSVGHSISHLVVDILPLLLRGMWITVEISVLSIVIGLFFGLIFGVANCQRYRRRVLGKLIDAYVLVVRGTPLFVQLLIVYFALPEVIGVNLTPFAAGVVALGFNSTAYLSETVRAGINAVPEGQWEVSYALGYSRLETLRSIIFPQMLRIIFPGLTNELTSLIKETSILAVIGVAELTKLGKDVVARELDPMTIYLVVALLYFVLTSAVSLVTKTCEKRMAV